MKNELKTPMFKVFSGNKSFHHYIFFKHFADNIEDYKISWEKLLISLSKNYPYYFQVKGGNKKDLIPDYNLAHGVQYCRQANGKRDDGSFQKGEYFNKIESGIEPLDLDPLIRDIELQTSCPEGEWNESTTMTKDPRKSTFKFIAMGVSKGERDNECFKAACDLRDCGYGDEDTFNKLIDGAEKCDPPFSEFEVRQKILSAWGCRLF